MSYVNKLFPFISEAEFIRNFEEDVSVDRIYCPIAFGNGEGDIQITKAKQTRPFKAYHILPCDTYVISERENIIRDIKLGAYGSSIRMNVIELDYSSVAKRIEVDDGIARILINGAYMQEDVATDVLINACSNYSKVFDELLADVRIDPKSSVSFESWVNDTKVDEAADYLDGLINDISAEKPINVSVNGSGEDFIYSWLDSYFRLPEGQDMKNGGREVVPLLIGPTGVFKSATVKELCKKYDYRLVDFRVSFTSRLDYSGLFQMGEIDGKKYSYSCPMEEIVTCSDGFREYCRKAHDKVQEILDRGYTLDDTSSDGNVVEGDKKYIDESQRAELEKLLDQYKEYMKTPVLFFDEVTRTTDGGVEGILVQLLNQKKFNNMTLNGCKFVAATNLNLESPDEYKSELDDIYDVNTDLDVAYSNRFMPLRVLPKDVEGRWFEWAAGEKKYNGKDVSNIHPLVLEFLKMPEHSEMIYNMKPVFDAIDQNLTDNEKKSQTFPNYRTWEMLSDYMYRIDTENELAKIKDENAVKEYRETIIDGLISAWAGKEFEKFLQDKGYKSYTEVHGEVNDDVGDFLQSTLGANVPALMIGPSSLGKTSRVKAYMKDVEKRTGLLPELIDVNLASCDTTDLMGMPTKVSLVDYVGGSGLNKAGLGSVGKELKSIIKDICADTTYGMVDTMTLRAPDMSKKAIFKKALEEGREVILFFDECNRVKNPTIMSAMFECFTGDTGVKLLDGRVLTMAELFDEAEAGNDELWTYSVTCDGKVIPAHIDCVIKKDLNSKLMEIEMEDGTIIHCTEDHKFMLKDGTYVMAKDLDESMDIMEVISRESILDDMSRVEGYELVMTNARPIEEFTHRVVAESRCGWYSGCGTVIHHSDFHKWNNIPSNLDCSMNYKEHIAYHGKHLEDVKANTDFEEKRLAGLHEYYSDAKRVESANLKRAHTFNSNPEMFAERNSKISETRKRKAAESEEYKMSMSKGLTDYNAKVASGEITKDYTECIKALRNLPDEVLSEIGRKRSSHYWGDIEHYDERVAERSEFFRNMYNVNPELRVNIANVTARRNSEPELKLKQKLGKIRKICIETISEYGDITAENYELVRVSRYKHGFPSYAKVLDIMSEVMLSIEDIVGGNF